MSAADGGTDVLLLVDFFFKLNAVNPLTFALQPKVNEYF